MERQMIWKLFSLISLCLPTASFAQSETTLQPEPNIPPTITVVQPVNPVSTNPGGPILLSMSVRLGQQFGNMTIETIIPEFHFVAPNGNAVLLHRDLLETSANGVHLNPALAINTPADAQKHGAVVTGGWTCRQGQYYVTVSAYILDDTGKRSNSIKYTVHCNGG